MGFALLTVCRGCAGPQAYAAAAVGKEGVDAHLMQLASEAKTTSSLGQKTPITTSDFTVTGSYDWGGYTADISSFREVTWDNPPSWFTALGTVIGNTGRLSDGTKWDSGRHNGCTQWSFVFDVPVTVIRGYHEHWSNCNCNGCWTGMA